MWRTKGERSKGEGGKKWRGIVARQADNGVGDRKQREEEERKSSKIDRIKEERDYGWS
jgi:hypothetical protein